MTGQLRWDATLFTPFDRGQIERLDLAEREDEVSLVAGTGSRTKSLSEVAAVAKRILAEAPLESEGNRTELFLRLHTLSDEIGGYNRQIDASAWITVFHIIFLILSLGLFSLKGIMKIENLSLQVEKLLGLADKGQAQTFLRSSVTVQDLYRFSPEEREEIADELGCAECYLRQKEVFDQIYRRGELGSVVFRLLDSPLELVAKENLGGVLLQIEEKLDRAPSVLRTLILNSWSIEQIALVFSGRSGARLWAHLFQKSEAREEFAKCPQDKVEGLILSEKLKSIRGVQHGFSFLFYLLSKEQWEHLSKKAIEVFRTEAASIQFTHLAITKEEFEKLSTLASSY